MHGPTRWRGRGRRGSHGACAMLHGVPVLMAIVAQRAMRRGGAVDACFHGTAVVASRSCNCGCHVTRESRCMGIPITPRSRISKPMVCKRGTCSMVAKQNPGIAKQRVRVRQFHAVPRHRGVGGTTTRTHSTKTPTCHRGISNVRHALQAGQSSELGGSAGAMQAPLITAVTPHHSTSAGCETHSSLRMALLCRLALDEHVRSDAFPNRGVG